MSLRSHGASSVKHRAAATGERSTFETSLLDCGSLLLSFLEDALGRVPKRLARFPLLLRQFGQPGGIADAGQVLLDFVRILEPKPG